MTPHANDLKMILRASFRQPCRNRSLLSPLTPVPAEGGLRAPELSWQFEGSSVEASQRRHWVLAALEPESGGGGSSSSSSGGTEAQQPQQQQQGGSGSGSRGFQSLENVRRVPCRLDASRSHPRAAALHPVRWLVGGSLGALPSFWPHPGHDDRRPEGRTKGAPEPTRLNGGRRSRSDGLKFRAWNRCVNATVDGRQTTACISREVPLFLAPVELVASEPA
jgi:hypothetical protein